MFSYAPNFIVEGLTDGDARWGGLSASAATGAGPQKEQPPADGDGEAEEEKPTGSAPASSSSFPSLFSSSGDVDDSPEQLLYDAASFYGKYFHNTGIPLPSKYTTSVFPSWILLTYVWKVNERCAC